jgi:hypothetical protein
LRVPELVSAVGVLIGGALLAVEYFNRRPSPLPRAAAE